MFQEIWYIKLGDRIEGPYSVQQLRHHPRVTPDTLAQKKEWSEWREIRAIFELRAVFEDDQPLIPIEASPLICEPTAEAVLDMRSDFPFFYLWLLLLLAAVLFYFYMQFHQ